LINYLADCDAERFQVNEYGDLNDPSRKTKMILNYPASPFTEAINELLSKEKFERKQSKWSTAFTKADIISENVKSNLFKLNKKLNEPQTIRELVKTLSSKINLFVGNSLPIRDFDYFSGTSSKLFNIYFNRGASGIDGIVSTALGAASIKKPTILLLGDLSFLHDLNSLLIAKKNKIPLMIVVINNNGGGIFQTLPISKKKKLLKEYFVSPQNLKLNDIVKAFGVKYKLIKNKNQLKMAINNLELNSQIVLEIKTNANESAKMRKKIFSDIKAEIDKQLTG
jgi:2-succinyl-5-enolpyruvyl-6-hydroxy-3-cyclohexene-1-carboxylate synthase